MQRALPPRVLFTVVVVITLILLLGSALLQRVVFRAEEVAGSLYLSPTSFVAPPGEEVRLVIRGQVPVGTISLGAELYLDYERARLKLEDAQSASPWQTLSLTDSDGRLSWILAPRMEEGATTELAGEVEFGRLKFRTQTEGPVRLSFDPTKSLLGVVAPGQEPMVYNALASVQDSAGAVRADASASTTAQLLGSPDPSPERKLSQALSAQRILANEVLTYPNLALVLVRLQYLGTVEIRFGPSPEMGSRLRSIGLSTAHSLKIAGLDEATDYYFQVVVEDQSGSRVVGPVKKFATNRIATGAIDPRASRLELFPASAKSDALALVVLRDSANNAVAAQSPRLSSESTNVRLAPVTEVNGLYESTVEFIGNGRERVSITATSGEQTIGKQTLVFNDKLEERSVPSQTKLILSVDERLMITVLGLTIVLFLAGAVFTRLIRAH